jgi:hypothetical protein
LICFFSSSHLLSRSLKIKKLKKEPYIHTYIHTYIGTLIHSFSLCCWSFACLWDPDWHSHTHKLK